MTYHLEWVCWIPKMRAWVTLSCYKTTKEDFGKVKFVLKTNGRTSIKTCAWWPYTVAVNPGRRPDTCTSVMVPWLGGGMAERHATEEAQVCWTLPESPSLQQLDYRRHTVVLKAFWSLCLLVQTQLHNNPINHCLIFCRTLSCDHYTFSTNTTSSKWGSCLRHVSAYVCHFKLCL